MGGGSGFPNFMEYCSSLDAGEEYLMLLQRVLVKYTDIALSLDDGTIPLIWLIHMAMVGMVMF